MGRFIFTVLYLLMHTFLLAQNEQKINEIQIYIEKVTAETNFVSDTEQGTVVNPADGSPVSFSRSFYALDEQQLFSVFYQEYGSDALQKIFYYKENQPIAVIIEYTDKSDTHKPLSVQIQYFFDEDKFLNLEELSDVFLPDLLVKEAKEYVTDYFQ